MANILEANRARKLTLKLDSMRTKEIENDKIIDKLKQQVWIAETAYIMEKQKYEDRIAELTKQLEVQNTKFQNAIQSITDAISKL